MADYIKKIRTDAGDLQIDYNALANQPKSDTSLTKSGSFADAKVAGDKITSINNNISDLKTSFVPSEISAAKTALIGSDSDTSESDTINGSKKYADTLNDTMDERVTSLESHDHSKQSINPMWIELFPGSDVNYGGHIDFHFNNSQLDFTSRIGEFSSGIISIEGGFKPEGALILVEGRTYGTETQRDSMTSPTKGQIFFVKV